MAERGTFPLGPVLLLGAALLYVLFHLHHVLVPFALAAAFAYICNPLIGFWEARGIRRSAAVVVLYLAAGGGAALLANTLTRAAAGQLASLQTNLPAYAERSRSYLSGVESRLAKRLPQGAKLVKKWDEKLYAPLVEQAQNLPGYLLGIFPLLSLVFLIPFIAFFLLVDGPGFLSGMIQACPSRYVEQALHLISDIDASLGNYLRGLVITALVIASASWLGLWALGVNQALLIAVLSGLSSFVPYLGAAIGAVAGGLVAVFQFGTAEAGLQVVLLFLLIRLADEALVQPLIAIHSVHLHPMVILLALMIGGEAFGLMGLVFAVPAVCIAKALVKVLWAWYSTQARLKGPGAVSASAIPYV